MSDLKIYLRGRKFGLCGAGDHVYAKRDEAPGVKKDVMYIITEIVDLGTGSCGRNLGIRVLYEGGIYSRRTFRRC
ncbi:hypothetical protein HN935_03780 [archaeon]|jgi:hypothetical protein|nr:hypothetical protein [archaeon]